MISSGAEVFARHLHGKHPGSEPGHQGSTTLPMMAMPQVTSVREKPALLRGVPEQFDSLIFIMAFYWLSFKHRLCQVGRFFRVPDSGMWNPLVLWRFYGPSKKIFSPLLAAPRKCLQTLSRYRGLVYGFDTAKMTGLADLGANTKKGGSKSGTASAH